MEPPHEKQFHFVTRQPNFTENNTAEGVFKGSLFKSLFKERKAILEGYPAVKKGLSFPEQSRSFEPGFALCLLVIVRLVS